MKATSVKTKTFSAATEAALDAAVAAFVAGLGEATLISLEFAVAAGPLFAAFLTYTL